MLILLVNLVTATKVDSRCSQYDWRLNESNLTVEGTVKDIKTVSDRAYVTMIVSKYLKGLSKSGNEVTFSYPGGDNGIALGFPHFDVGEKARVFLYYSDSDKEYSVICAGLGKESITINNKEENNVKSNNLIIETKDFYKPNESIEIKLTNKGNESVYVVYGDGCGLGFDIFNKYNVEEKSPVTIKDPELACLMMYRIEEVKTNENKMIGTWNQKEYVCADGVCNLNQVSNGNYVIELTLTDKNIESTYTISKKIIINPSNAEENRPAFVRFWTWLTSLFSKR